MTAHDAFVKRGIAGHAKAFSYITGARQDRAMSSKRLDSIADFARHGYRLRVDCLSCRRVAILEPRGIVQLCSQKGWSRDIHAVQRRLRCSACGSREVRCGPAFGS